MIFRGFRVFEYDKKRKPGNVGNQEKAFYIRKYTLLTDLVPRKLLKSNQVCM